MTRFYTFKTLYDQISGGQRQRLAIAHRTTTIKQADYIYLIEEGKGLNKEG